MLLSCRSSLDGNLPIRQNKCQPCQAASTYSCVAQASASRSRHVESSYYQATSLHIMQSQIWASTIPLSITYTSSSTPYLIAVPRLSYLPLLLPRLTSFFGPASSFSYQGILLKNLPVGLLFDLYQPELPWRLELGDGPLFDIHDTYINSVKEVHFKDRNHYYLKKTDRMAGRLHTQWHS